MGEIRDEDVMLRGLVALVEAQGQQLTTLKTALSNLEGRLALRSQVDQLLGHELRTPLTVVIGVLQTLSSVDLDTEQRQDFVERALLQATHLAETVEDLMTVPTNGGQSMTRARMRPVSVRQLVDQACAAIPGLVASQRVRIDADRSLIVNTAPSRFVAILVNLLENAVKYGGIEPIEVSAHLDSERTLILEVADRGPGLGGVPADLLFEAFSRGYHKATMPGHGIGLYLVLMIAQSLGGTAALEERPGGGTTARVELPQRRTDDPIVQRDSEVSLAVVT
ncbi:MAG: sensor histidine kinase [Acidimicrobiales bacterium]